MNGWTCNMKSSGKFERMEERTEEGKCTLHCWENCGFTRPFWEFWRHLVDSRAQLRRWGGNTYPGKRKLFFEIKRRKIKN